MRSPTVRMASLHRRYYFTRLIMLRKVLTLYFAIISVVVYAQVAEHDPVARSATIAAKVMADEVGPEGIIVPDEIKPGRFIPVDIVLNGFSESWTVSYTWLGSPGLDLDGRNAVPGKDRSFKITGDVGEQWLECLVAVWDGQKVYARHFRKEFTIGNPKPPEPDKPLNQLVDKQTADALVNKVFARLKQWPTYESYEDFFGTYLALLELNALLDNPGREAIDKKLSAADSNPFEQEMLTAVLDLIIAELGVPVVTPKPDEPGPAPGPGTPVSFTDFRVLFVYESEPETRDQDWVIPLLAAPRLDSYLDEKATGGWRRWDDDVPTTNAPEWLRQMFGIQRPPTPSVVIADEGKAQAFALPQDPEALMSLLTTYGG